MLYGAWPHLRFAGRFMERFAGRFTERFTERCAGRFTGRCAGRFTGRCAGRYTSLCEACSWPQAVAAAQPRRYAEGMLLAAGRPYAEGMSLSHMIRHVLRHHVELEVDGVGNTLAA